MLGWLSTVLVRARGITVMICVGAFWLRLGCLATVFRCCARVLGRCAAVFGMGFGGLARFLLGGRGSTVFCGESEEGENECESHQTLHVNHSVGGQENIRGRSYDYQCPQGSPSCRIIGLGH